MKYLQFFILISLACLGYYLYKIEVFVLPSNINFFWLMASLLSSLSGIIFFGLSWHATLTPVKRNVKGIMAIMTHNISLPGKYVPGKLWSVLGRSLIISNWYQIPLSQASFLSMYNQMLMIWFGIPFAAIPFIPFSFIIPVAIISVWIAVTLVLLRTNFISILTNKLFQILKLTNADSLLSIKNSFDPLSFLYFLLYWLFLSASLMFVLLSLNVRNSLFFMSFLFPLSGVIGNAVVIFPAGLGIKEGIMTTYFNYSSMSLGLAVIIPVIHRMVLVCSDILLFIPSYFYYLILVKKSRKKKK